MQDIEEIRRIAQQQGTREAIVPAVLYLLKQGVSPTGHAVHKTIGQGSQTTINDQIKVAYSTIGNALAPLLEGNAGEQSSMPALFNTFLSLFDMATQVAASTWQEEKTAILQESQRLSDANVALAGERMELAGQLQVAMASVVDLQGEAKQQVEAATVTERKLADTVAALARSHADHDATNQRLVLVRQDLDASREEVGKLRARLDEETIKLQQVIADADATKKCADKYQAECGQLQQQLQHADASLHDSHLQLLASRQACQEALTEAVMLREQLATAETQREKHGKEMQRAIASLDAARNAQACAEEAHRDALSHVSELKEQLTSVQAVNKVLEGLIERLSVPTKE